jgi:thioredoxin reductase
MVPERVRKALLFTRLVIYSFRYGLSLLGRILSEKVAALTARTPPNPPVDPSEVKNIVVVGAAFAGYFAARFLAGSLPRNGRYRVVVVEPNSHFNFTWVLPRFCVVESHEHKAFIPYRPDFFARGPTGMVRWVRDRVTSVQRGYVILRSGEQIPYEFLIIATGSTVGSEGLPSRVGSEDKQEGVELLKAMQARIKAARRIVVAGGGAAGVELVTDAKNQYPDKPVTLVHSRHAVMHRFGPGLQRATMDALERLGIDVVLGERVDLGSVDGESIALSSGRRIECDCFVSLSSDNNAVCLKHGKDTTNFWGLDKLHRTETRVRSDCRCGAQGHLPVGPYPCQADAPDRRRLPPQRLRMRRCGRDRRPESERETRHAPGRDRLGQRRADGKGKDSQVYVQAGLGRRSHQADAGSGEHPYH